VLKHPVIMIATIIVVSPPFQRRVLPRMGTVVTLFGSEMKC